MRNFTTIPCAPRRRMKFNRLRRLHKMTDEITRLQAHDDYESEIARIVEEADGLIGEMPE